jgi:hypothetical protein
MLSRQLNMHAATTKGRFRATALPGAGLKALNKDL